MLRITTFHGPEVMLLKLEGSVRGPWVTELQKAWSQTSGGDAVEVDLRGVSFADSKGRDVLVEMKNEGAILTGASAFLRQILGETSASSAVKSVDAREN